MNGELGEFIGSARWFGGKGREFRLGEIRRLPWLEAEEETATAAPELHTRIELVRVEYDDGSGELYQLPLAYYPFPQERLAHARIGEWHDEELGQVHVYDALHDRAATTRWLQAFAAAAGSGEHRVGELVFHRLPGHQLDAEAPGTLFSGEQSNSSVAFGEDSLMKVFRKVTSGRNPDIEIHEALTTAGLEHVAHLYGWLELPAADGGEPVQLAMLQQFLRTASDGWDLALASVRDLFAEADLHADEVGGDFGAESHRLGVATAHVHTALADHFPTETWDAQALQALATAMHDRLAEAATIVPELQQHADGLRTAFDALATVQEPVVAQRVHGDLHLGQTLRTVKGWKIVDFEGEPAKRLADRVRPDSAWRDVAGMLRSFDYAAHAVEVDLDADPEAHAQIAYRAGEWAERNRTQFLVGYLVGLGRGEDGELTEGEKLLVRAYEIDKAVYETVYEARNRPAWLHIPLAAVGRLARAAVQHNPPDPGDEEATAHE